MSWIGLQLAMGKDPFAGPPPMPKWLAWLLVIGTFLLLTVPFWFPFDPSHSYFRIGRRKHYTNIYATYDHE